MSCSPNTGTVPPYSTSPNPYPAAVYPVRSTYPQQNPYAQVWTVKENSKLPEDGAAMEMSSSEFCRYNVMFSNSETKKKKKS